MFRFLFDEELCSVAANLKAVCVTSTKFEIDQTEYENAFDVDNVVLLDKTSSSKSWTQLDPDVAFQPEQNNRKTGPDDT